MLNSRVSLLILFDQIVAHLRAPTSGCPNFKPSPFKAVILLQDSFARQLLPLTPVGGDLNLSRGRKPISWVPLHAYVLAAGSALPLDGGLLVIVWSVEGKELTVLMSEHRNK